MWVKKQQLELDMEQLTDSRMGRKYDQAVFCHLAYLISMQSVSCKILDWMNHKLESRFARRNSNNLRYANDTTIMAESEEELKSLLMSMNKEGEKTGLKFNIQNSEIMASSPITSWKVEREKVEAVTDFFFLGYNITADGDYSWEIKRRLFLGRKVMTNLESILKSRDSTLPTKVCLVKMMVFPTVMYGSES